MPEITIYVLKTLVPNGYLEPVIAHRLQTVIVSGSSPWSVTASHPQTVLLPAQRTGPPQMVYSINRLQDFKRLLLTIVSKTSDAYY
jgi:hypothetical protein